MADHDADVSDFTESMVVLFVEPDDAITETYGTEGHVMENVYTIALTERDAEPFVEFMREEVGVDLRIDTSHGMAMTQVIAETLADVPPQIISGVDRLDTVSVTRGDGYVIVTLPPESAAYLIKKSGDEFEKYQTMHD